MPRDGKKTKIRILNDAISLVYENGFSGTTIDSILERTGLTKGALFYHFKDKATLGYEMIKHFKETDMQYLQQASEYSAKNSTDPKSRLLKFVQWFIDFFDELTEPHAGCLYASYIYEPEQFGPEVKQIVAEGILEWREFLSFLMVEAKMDTSVGIASLADMFTVILEGAFVTSKALNEPKLTANQMRHYQKYLTLLLQ